MYIVLETYWKDNVYILDNKVFDSFEEAEDEASELQQGIVIEINPQV